MDLSRRATAEGVGTALLLIAIVGSGNHGRTTRGRQYRTRTTCERDATGSALVAIILAFEPISGAHLNPVVTITAAWQGGVAWPDVRAYVGAQVVGAIAGVGVANAMFGLPAFFMSHHVRAGASQLLGEGIATFGLLTVIWGCARGRSQATSFAVGAYIAGAYWFTSSTSFANPAMTIARSLTDTFAGIRPRDVAPFILARVYRRGRSDGSFPLVLADVAKHRAGGSCDSHARR